VRECNHNKVSVVHCCLQKDGDQNNVKADEASEEHSTPNKVLKILSCIHFVPVESLHNFHFVLSRSEQIRLAI
jgi:hypothetical protein